MTACAAWHGALPAWQAAVRQDFAARACRQHLKGNSRRCAAVRGACGRRGRAQVQPPERRVHAALYTQPHRERLLHWDALPWHQRIDARYCALLMVNRSPCSPAEPQRLPPHACCGRLRRDQPACPHVLSEGLQIGINSTRWRAAAKPPGGAPQAARWRPGWRRGTARAPPGSAASAGARCRPAGCASGSPACPAHPRPRCSADTRSWPHSPRL